MTDTNQRQLGNTLWQQGQGTISVLGCRGDAGSGDPAYRVTLWVGSTRGSVPPTYTKGASLNCF